MEDRHLIKLFFVRAEKALQILKERYGNTLYRIAMNILGNHQDAEETTDDTYLAIWNAIPPKEPDPLAPYVYRTGRNMALKRLEYLSAEKRNKFVYNENDISLSVCNRGAINSEIHNYWFIIDCKSPEEASNYFDECHKKMMDLYKSEEGFVFKGTENETDYKFENGNAASYSVVNENGKQKTNIINDDGSETPIEESDTLSQVKTKINSYDMSNTVGAIWELSYTEGESSVCLWAEIMY